MCCKFAARPRKMFFINLIVKILKNCLKTNLTFLRKAFSIFVLQWMFRAHSMTSQYGIGPEHDDVIKRTTFIEKKNPFVAFLLLRWMIKIFETFSALCKFLLEILGKTQKNSYPICFYVSRNLELKDWSIGIISMKISSL